MILNVEGDDADMLILWDNGFNTYEISARYGIKEGEADQRLWRAREQRRIKRQELVSEFA